MTGRPRQDVLPVASNASRRSLRGAAALSLTTSPTSSVAGSTVSTRAAEATFATQESIFSAFYAGSETSRVSAGVASTRKSPLRLSCLSPHSVRLPSDPRAVGRVVGGGDAEGFGRLETGINPVACGRRIRRRVCPSLAHQTASLGPCVTDATDEVDAVTWCDVTERTELPVQTRLINPYASEHEHAERLFQLVAVNAVNAVNAVTLLCG